MTDPTASTTPTHSRLVALVARLLRPILLSAIDTDPLIRDALLQHTLLELKYGRLGRTLKAQMAAEKRKETR